MSRRVCVIGAGVVGLSTAFQIQTRLHDVTVTIVTEHLSPDTTGDGSGGFWEPHYLGDTPSQKIRQWAGETLRHMVSLAKSPNADEIGAFLQNGYWLQSEEHDDIPWSDIILGYRHMTKSEVQMFPPQYKYGVCYTNPTLQCRKYLPWLLARFKNSGGKLVRQKVHDFGELSKDYDVIVNCTGIGARELCNDMDLIPTQGQMMRVRAPWVKHFTVTKGDGPYILLGDDHVLLGGTHKQGRFDRDVDFSVKEKILQDCCQLIPSLKHAVHLEDWVGLRPTRSSGVRLERETIWYGDKPLQIVHNYGHGGGGVTLHWGCATEVTGLVAQALEGITSTSKL